MFVCGGWLVRFDVRGGCVSIGVVGSYFVFLFEGVELCGFGVLGVC